MNALSPREKPRGVDVAAIERTLGERNATQTRDQSGGQTPTTPRPASKAVAECGV